MKNEFKIDEGFDSEDYTFNYGISSGVCTLNTQSDANFVLHYFVATEESEKLLENYISTLIHSFLNSYGSVNAKDSPVKNDFLDLNLDSTEIEKYLKDLKQNLIEKSTKTGSPLMIGHMTTALPFFHRPLAKLLVALNQNVVKTETASTFTALERQTIAMLHNAFYKQNSEFYAQNTQNSKIALGVVCSGGTLANLSAMWIARNKALGPNATFEGVAKCGLLPALLEYKYKNAVIVGSEMMHYSFKKAVDLLGLGENGLILIKTDENYRMRTDLLKEKLDELQSQSILVLAVVAIAGTTETGSIDPIDEICRIAHSRKIHTHVDAAWGGPLIFSREHSYKMLGIDKADSITVDGHKQLYTPMGIGVLLLKDPNLITSIKKTAAYVIRNDSNDLGKFTVEGSRPANALYLHANLSLLGKDGLNSLLTRSCTLVRQMANRLQQHPSKAFEILHHPQTNIILFRYLPIHLRAITNYSESDSEILDKLVVDIQEYMAHLNDGQTHGFISRTNVFYKNRRTNAFRVVIANPLTEWNHIEHTILDLLHIGALKERLMMKKELENRVLRQYPFLDNSLWMGWPFDI